MVRFSRSGRRPSAISLVILRQSYTMEVVVFDKRCGGIAQDADARRALCPLSPYLLVPLSPHPVALPPRHGVQ